MPDAPAGGRRRGPRKGDLREAAILDTAEALLIERPMAAIGIDELARGAGITRSTFYFYFDSREAVLRALAARLADLVFEAAESWLRRGDEAPYAAIRRAIATNLALWHEHGAVLRAIVNACGGDAELGRFWAGAGDRFVAAVADQVRHEREAGLALPAPPRAADLATVLACMTERASYRAAQRDLTPRELDGLADTLATVWHRAIYGPEPHDGP